MADWDTTNPEDSGIVSQYPANARAAREAVVTNFGVDHHEANDADVGKHEVIQVLDNAADPTIAAGEVGIWNNGGVLKTRSGAGAAVAMDVFPAGTRMVFCQASAPTGWTSVTTLNDRVLRVFSSSGGGTGGSWILSGFSVDGHSLTVPQLPAHDHGGGGNTGNAGTHAHVATGDLRGAHNHGGTLDAGAHSHGGTQNAGAHSHTGTTAGAGGHAHGAATGADGGHNHSGTTASNGSHNHSGTTSADGVHTHNWRSRSNAGSDAYGPIADIDRSISSGTTSDTDFLLNNTGLLNAGNHTHTFTTSTQAAHTHTFTTNTVANHTHTIESVGNHTHTFTTSSEPGHAHDIPTAPAHSHNITADGEHTHAITVQNAGSHNHTFSIPVQGAGALHSHGLSYTAGWRPRYVDVLICEKD